MGSIPIVGTLPYLYIYISDSEMVITWVFET